jgi:hypothetical protein
MPLNLPQLNRLVFRELFWRQVRRTPVPLNYVPYIIVRGGRNAS